MPRRDFRFLLVVVLTLAGCRCDQIINPVETRFRVAAESERIDFGRVLEGTVVTRQVTLIAETRVAVTVGLATKTPFSVEPVAELPGGGQLDVTVTFRAGNGEAQGELVITSGRQELTVSLRGLGVRPPVCVPSAACRLSAYSLELDRCVESIAPDEAACDPDSQCLEQGRCRMGQCLGVARRCFDNDACTADACAMDAGCVHPRITCPAPTMPCRVATCDARTGCGETTALDGTPCGAADCVSARICVLGACQEVPTPNGTECGPPVACYGPSRCANQKCVRPDAGVYRPEWSARIEGTPLEAPPALLFGPGATVYFSVCGLDGGMTLDAGAPTDGGDAGLPVFVPLPCAVLSYTSTGFDRFIERAPAPEPLSHVGQSVVVTRTDGGLVFRSRTSGSYVTGWETGSRLQPQQVAALSDGGVVIAFTTDAGPALFIVGVTSTEPLVSLPSAAEQLAVTETDAVVALAGGRLWLVAAEADGGHRLQALADAGPGPLALTQQAFVVGDQRWLAVDDGGFEVVQLEGPGDAGVSERELLVSPTAIALVFRACRVLPMSCLPEDSATWVRVFARDSGALIWEDQLVPAGLPARVVETALVPVPGIALAAVLEAFDGGAESGLVLSLDGGRAIECPFPPGTGHLVASVFRAGQLITLAVRADGGTALEGWSLGPLPLETRGWPSAEGLYGQRRATP